MLKIENARLLKENKKIEKLLLELEELREMVYGKKQRDRKNKKVQLSGKENQKEEKIERTPESYRRKEPGRETITGEIWYKLSLCPDCGETLEKRKEHVNYREDLTGLSMLLKEAKKVTKRIIESGYCKKCGKRKSTMEIPKQKMTIGQNIKATIVYLHVLLGLSYREIEEYLKTQFDIEISSGMISRSMEEQSDLLRPYYQNIYRELLYETGCHYDESAWKIQGESEGNYAWVKTGATSNNVIFWFGRSRGKGVAEKLRGDMNEGMVKKQVGISDDYGSYRNLFQKHQLCFAHPNRKLRDLAKSSVLEEKKRKHCEEVYKHYANVYRKARILKEEYDSGKKNEAEIDPQVQMLKEEFLELAEPHEQDPEKLRNIKESLKAHMDRYFTCFQVCGIPLDNNKAERALRRVVLKRKKSFGSKSQKGANVLSILYSVVFSIYWSYPAEEFLDQYKNALNLEEGEE